MKNIFLNILVCFLGTFVVFGKVYKEFNSYNSDNDNDND
jgi:hypothetical protein